LRAKKGFREGGKRRSVALPTVNHPDEAKKKADQLAADLAALEPGPDPIPLDLVIGRYLLERGDASERGIEEEP
jgi:hypothetical protein